MKRFGHFTGWSIAARLVALALVPATLMLIAVNVSLYAVARDEAVADIKERGRLVAAALAEGSSYGVISGNAASIERTARALMATDPSIISIEVLDARRVPVVAVQIPHRGSALQTFEAAIGSRELDVNLFDTLPPPTGAADPLASRNPAVRPVGHVRVTMSPEPLLQAKRDRLYFGSAMVLLAALVSAAVGLALSKRLREPLNAVMAALRGIRQGRYHVQLDEGASGELGELQATIVDMAKGLELTHQHLESEVALRTRELEDAVETVRIADAEKRRLIARGNELVEEERRRISLEIHDDLNAVLVSARLQAAALAASAGAQGQPDLQHSAERIAELIDAMYVRARNIVQKLRPEIIDTLGLTGAIEEMVRHVDEIHPGCRIELVISDRLPTIPEHVTIAAYRVVQEALSNVVKHAAASSCVVTLDNLPEEDCIRVTVRDNGKGFVIADTGRIGLGLVGMRERVAALAGSLDIESTPGAGTCVTLILPWRAP